MKTKKEHEHCQCFDLNGVKQGQIKAYKKCLEIINKFQWNKITVITITFLKEEIEKEIEKLGRHD